MTPLYSAIFSSRCTSNHHRIALDALRHLATPDAEKWRNVLLHFHAAYLKGAKAPDETFKDFKNHVCHVKDNYWGGAPKAAAEWYETALTALKAKSWKEASYAFGVMSHYLVDPIQPFHTAQTETENVIHRAVEQSFSKAYGQFQQILDSTNGYRDVSLPTGADWMVKLVRAGAEAANPAYDIIIDHYDFERGAKKPLEGLDDTLRNAIAPLVGRAVVTLARVLDRAIEEAAVKPPMTLPPIDALGVQITAPLHKFAASQAAGKEAAYVKRMHKEFKKTGKVSKTLPSDDKEVRALYAVEVLNVPVSKLDAEMPRAFGTAHGQALAGTPKAAVPRVETKAAPKADTEPKAEIAAPVEPKAKKEPKPKAEKAPAPPKEEKVAKAPAPRKKKKEAETVYDPDSPFAVLRQNNTTASAPADDALLEPAPAPPPPPGVRLHRDDHIVDAPAIGPKAAARFEAIGFKTVADLLEASPEDIAKSLRQSHMTPPIIRDWQAQALLACTLPNVRSIDAQALVASGVRDPEALVKHDAKKLLGMVEAFLNTPNGKQLARGGKPPTLDVVKSWIEAAKKTPKQAIRAA